jgi:hypothetical protein
MDTHTRTILFYFSLLLSHCVGIHIYNIFVPILSMHNSSRFSNLPYHVLYSSLFYILPSSINLFLGNVLNDINSIY